VAVAPFLAWYRVDVAGRDVTFTGVDAAGITWSLTVLGACAAAAALAGAVRARPGWRLPAAAVSLCGALATAWALMAILAPAASAVPAGIPAPPAAPLAPQPAALLAAAGASALAAVGLSWLRSGAGASSVGT
jgi:hypothetical protein